ncbi:MAG TPA: methyltransferase domain-containing protein [Acetobacteraceae bacterium]|nr:methyltransferase domain-containing protein [Acetobacteraceae bacterium]
MDRITRLRGMSTRMSRILEIGPGHAPIAPKAEGWNTFVVDHATREGLRQKYRHDPAVSLDAIEEVDAVWHHGRLHDAVPQHLHGTFDTLIASHVIEHLPDLAGFLVSAAMLAAPHATVALAIPDRRYCFDYFKPATLTGDVLEAYVERRSRHAARTLWNQTAYSVAWDGTTAWGQQPIREVGLTSDFENAKVRFQTFMNGVPSEYIDCHTWHFTPSGFALVMLELGQLGIIDWHVDSLEGPAGCEFFAILRRGINRDIGAAAVQEERLRLLRQQLVELREQLDFVLGLEPAIAAPTVTPADLAAPTVAPIVDPPHEPARHADNDTNAAAANADNHTNAAAANDDLWPANPAARTHPDLPRIMIAERFMPPFPDLDRIDMPDDLLRIAPGSDLDAVIIDAHGAFCRRSRIMPPPRGMPGNRIEFPPLFVDRGASFWLFVIAANCEDGAATPGLVDALLAHARRLGDRPPINLLWAPPERTGSGNRRIGATVGDRR